MFDVVSPEGKATCTIRPPKSDTFAVVVSLTYVPVKQFHLVNVRRMVSATLSLSRIAYRIELFQVVKGPLLPRLSLLIL